MNGCSLLKERRLLQSFNTSRPIVIKAHFFPKALPTLVPPAFPEPTLYKSTPLSFEMIKAKEIDPNR